MINQTGYVKVVVCVKTGNISSQTVINIAELFWAPGFTG